MKIDPIGGQAVVEGVMMRSANRVAIAVRDPNGAVVGRQQDWTPYSKRHKLLGLPLVRGAATLVESMVLGYRMLNLSAAIATGEEEGKDEGGWGMFIALAAFILLFKFIPASIFSFLKPHIENIMLLNTIEGVVRIGIFVAYLAGISLLPDVKRLFQYHGAEHQVIHCYEKGEPVTVENAKTKSPLHPRCGTSFILITFVLSILVFTLLGRSPSIGGRVLSQLALLPVIAGISYELIRVAGKASRGEDGWGPKLAMIITSPGLLLQKLTTRRADDEQIEVAIASLNGALGEENSKLPIDS
jgi:uncharacterized protein YqhQ